jgi:zinc protease
MWKPWISSTLLATLSAAAGAAAPPVFEYHLDNGMGVLVKVDRRAPVVVSQVWYKVGSSYEHSGITGISHVLEHMMFKGTEKYGPNEFSRIVAANGGQENAFTGRDYTAYYQQLEKSRLEVSFQLESDRMRNLLLDPKEFDKEVQVVMEERRLRTEDDPQAIMAEQFSAAAYVNNPYHNPIIGWMADLQSLTAEDLKHWYERWYAPNNATVVVVGDVDPEQVHALANKYFGPLKPSTIPATKPRRDVAQRGERRIIVKAPAELPAVILGYHVPVLRTADESWEPYALEVLANVLDGGESARFSTQLVRGSQVAAGLATSYDLYTRNDSLFAVSGTPTPDHDIVALEKAIREEIRKISEEPPTAEELQRVKAQVVAANVYKLDSVFYQANQLGTLVTTGLDWRVDEEFVEKIRAITPEQVQAVARKYLVEDNLTVATLEPQPINAATEETSAQ